MANEKGKDNRIWRANKSADAGLYLTPNAAYLIGNEKNFVTANENGVQICGGLTQLCMSEQIRQGGLFVKMNDFVRMVPQTIVTPIPSQIPFPPIMFPLAILAGLPFFIAMLAVAGK